MNKIRLELLINHTIIAVIFDFFIKMNNNRVYDDFKYVNLIYYWLLILRSMRFIYFDISKATVIYSRIFDYSSYNVA